MAGAEHLRVGLVFDDSLDRSDGVQQYVMTLGRWLIEEDHDVRFLVGETTKPSDLTPFIRSMASNISVSANHNRLSIPLPANRAHIREVLEQEEFDVLHVQMPYSPWLAGRVIAAAAPRTAVVGSFHIVADGWQERIGTRLLAWYEKKGLSRFDSIMSASEPAQQFAKQYYGVDSQVVPNVVDLRQFSQAAYSGGEQLILFLGRLVSRKGCQHLLGGLGKLEQQGKLAGWRVVVAGDGPMRPQLEAQAAHLGLSEHAEFVGYVSEEEKAGLLGRAAIAIFPSTGNESFGIVLAEAMAAGAPVVLGGDNAGYRYVLGEQAEYNLVDPTDYNAFSEKLGRLMQDKELRNRLRAWQQERVKDFAVQQVGPRIISVYRAAIAGRVAKAVQSRHTKA